MLRISVSADEVPQEVIEAVKEVHARSGRHMRRVCLTHPIRLALSPHQDTTQRCDQFTNLSQSREVLRRMIASTHSSSVSDWSDSSYTRSTGQHNAAPRLRLRIGEIRSRSAESAFPLPCALAKLPALEAPHPGTYIIKSLACA